MPRPRNLSKLTFEELAKLRDEVASVLNEKAADLQRQLDALTGQTPRRGRPPGKSGRKNGKVAPQFRSKKQPSLVWSGRGALPRWMKDEMKGTKLTKESFRIKPA